MENLNIVHLGSGISLIDGYDLNMKGRTGTYVLNENPLTLIETGPAPSVKYILEGLKDMGLDPAQVRYITLTHIHLDHAGGAGLLIKECPNAEIIVHPRGRRHLADPSRLISGAKQVYGDLFDDLFDPVLPIPDERMRTMEDGGTLVIGDGRTLTFYDSPGHARHHFSIHDSLSSGIFTGDTAGVRYHQTQDNGFTFYLPSTSPNQFDPAAMRQSIEKFEALEPARIYFGHFSASDEPVEVFRQVRDWLPRFVAIAETVMEAGGGQKEIKTRLMDEVESWLQSKGVPDGHEVYQVLEVDLEVCAMGLEDCLTKSRLKNR